jgi:hypothetical protein
MNPRLLRPTASGFDPRRVNNLAIWLDASDSSTVTVATGVSEWRNRLSGTGIAATQGIANSQPAYQTAQQNGKNALYFDGSNDSLVLGNLSATFPSAGTLVAAYRPDADNEYTLVRTGNNSSFWLFSGSTYMGVFRGSRVNNVSSPQMPTNANAVVAVTSDSSAYRIYINNILRHDLAADFSAGTSHAIGINDLGTTYKGWAYEFLYYSRALTASELSAAYKYLQAKWAI